MQNPSIPLMMALGWAWLTPFGAVAAERLDRGVVALAQTNGAVYVGWRLLASDPPDVAFDVFHAESANGPREKLNDTPIANSCNFVDTKTKGRDGFYVIQPRGGGAKAEASRPEKSGSDAGFVRIKLQGNYRAQKVGLADLDGDGQLDYLVKQPDFNTDPYQQPGYWKKSQDTYKPLLLQEPDGHCLSRWPAAPPDRRARHLHHHQVAGL